ncbi:LOW QUALITY PROTEIN: RNA-binding protein NOB1-like [Ptychodera flava]|uniref:LOW QUALITY PROTEIN: RNA-binding protein NOB1-like n=1 Tax=Ptychodera flava TaxID=63121 RepID=UPI00396A671B
MASRSVVHVVVDSAAFIKNADVQNIAENVYTIQDVVSEIRDAATRKRLAVLPYDLQFRQPSPESIATVTEFAKKTGDYPSLSAVDVRVMALAYHLTKEHIGTEHLKKEPAQKATWSSSRRPLERATDIIGWYLAPKSKEERVSCPDSELNIESKDIDRKGQEVDIEKSQKGNDVILERIEDVSENCPENIEEDREEMKASECVLEGNVEAAEGGQVPASSEDVGHSTGENGRTVAETSSVCNGDKAEECNTEDVTKQQDEQLEVDSDICDGNNDDSAPACDDDDDEEDDEEGWITPQNIYEAKSQMKDKNMEPIQNVSVGCMTSDFAMQNVLIQMGIPVISVGGMLIKRAKSYVLKCSACFKVTSIMTKQFCPKCGNKTLKKVSVTVDEDGSQHYHISRRKELNTRGLKYSIPAPKGGKHACNPILVEDQPLPQNRPSKKSLQKTSAFDPEYVANMSPFALNDVTSRAAQLGIRQSSYSGSRRNPNENRRKKRR